jgi:hypothetical protein
LERTIASAYAALVRRVVKMVGHGELKSKQLQNHPSRKLPQEITHSDVDEDLNRKKALLGISP